jgi:glycine oxidase
VNTSYDCIIVGGGLIGLFAARLLAKDGLRVVIIERGEIARESSWAGGGILSPLYPWRYPDAVNVLARYSQTVYLDLADELRLASGIDPQYTRSGLLAGGVVADDVAAWARRFDVRMAPVDSVGSFESRWHRPLSGVYFPDIAQVRNPRLAQALRVDLDRSGVTMLEHTPVQKLEVEAHKAVGVRTERGLFASPRVLVASGAWSAQILAPFDFTVPVKPIRGQMLLFAAPPGFLRHIILADEHYLIPRQDGLILVGSTLEDVGFDKSTTAQAEAELRQFVALNVPELLDFPLVKHWSGLRPASPQGVPVISAHPRIQGLFAAAGHFRNGVVLAPATAEILASLIRGEAAFCDIQPYGWK